MFDFAIVIQAFVEGLVIYFFYCSVLTPKYNKWFIIIAASLSYLIAGRLVMSDRSVFELIRLIAVYATQVFWIILAFKDSYIYRLFIFIIPEVLLFIGELLLGMIIQQVMGILPEDRSPELIIIAGNTIVLIQAALLFVASLFIKTIQKKFSVSNPILFIAFPLSQLVLIVCYMLLTAVRSIPIETIALIVSMGCVLAIVADGLLLKAILDISEKQHLKSRLESMEMQRQAEFSRLNESNAINEENRKLRHDINNNLVAMNTLLEDAEYEKAKEMLQSLVGNIIELDSRSYSGNPVIDAVLSYKLSYAHSLGIVTDVDMHPLSELPIDDIDLCSLYSNLMDNAIEGCRQVDGAKELRCISHIKKGFLLIKTENTSQEPKLAEKTLLSGKRGYAQAGLGTRIIKDIAEKYSGAFDVSYQDGIFIATTLIQI